MEFILGCNYWASNAGADMWRDFDIECIDKDIRILGGSGVLLGYTVKEQPISSSVLLFLFTFFKKVLQCNWR